MNGPAASSPTLGSQGVESLPLETWTHIFRSVPFHKRQPITLVCQTFRWLAQPLVFEYLEISIGKGYTEDMLNDKLEFLTSSHIAPAVTVCWWYTLRSGMTSAQRKFSEMGLVVLSQFPNLVALRLQGFMITRAQLDTFAGFRHLSELELINTTHEADDPLPLKHPILLGYLKSAGTVVSLEERARLGHTSATLVHPTYTHTLVLAHWSPEPFKKILVTGSIFALRSFTVNTRSLASFEFTGILGACPALEELRFPVESDDLVPLPRFPFNEPPKSALSHLRVFQGPWYMVEAFTKDRPVAHLVMWDFYEEAEGAIQMLARLGARHPIESLELHTQTLTNTVASALASVNVTRALSIVIESYQAQILIHSVIEEMNISPTLEYFACDMADVPPFGKSLVPLVPQNRFPRLRYLCDYDSKCYNPATGDAVEKKSLENWQRNTLGLYRPLIDCYVRTSRELWKSQGMLSH